MREKFTEEVEGYHFEGRVTVKVESRGIDREKMHEIVNDAVDSAVEEMTNHTDFYLDEQ